MRAVITKRLSWHQRLLTGVLVLGLAILLYPVLRWATLDAVWSAQSAGACRGARGACWPVIVEKVSLITFGRYPVAELWRPTLASLLLLGVAIATAVPRFWGKGLLAVWLGSATLFVALLGGGIAGLATVPWTQWGGLPITIMLSVFGIAVAFPCGIVLACARISPKLVVRWFATAYIELVRGVPLITILFMATFILPLLLPAAWEVNAMVRAQVAIILFAAAYLAEVVRAGLQAVPKGQFEASAALGLSRFLIYTRIVLPQALTKVIAPTINTFISILKDTSLVAIVSISDLLMTARQALADPLWRTHFIEIYLFVALIYFSLCFAMSQWSKRLEHTYVFAKGRY